MIYRTGRVLPWNHGKDRYSILNNKVSGSNLLGISLDKCGWREWHDIEGDSKSYKKSRRVFNHTSKEVIWIPDNIEYSTFIEDLTEAIEARNKRESEREAERLERETEIKDLESFYEDLVSHLKDLDLTTTCLKTKMGSFVRNESVDLWIKIPNVDLLFNHEFKRKDEFPLESVIEKRDQTILKQKKIEADREERHRQAKKNQSKLMAVREILKDNEIDVGTGYNEDPSFLFSASWQDQRFSVYVKEVDRKKANEIAEEGKISLRNKMIKMKKQKVLKEKRIKEEKALENEMLKTLDSHSIKLVKSSWKGYSFIKVNLKGKQDFALKIGSLPKNLKEFIASVSGPKSKFFGNDRPSKAIREIVQLIQDDLATNANLGNVSLSGCSLVTALTTSAFITTVLPILNALEEEPVVYPLVEMSEIGPGLNCWVRIKGQWKGVTLKEFKSCKDELRDEYRKLLYLYHREAEEEMNRSDQIAAIKTSWENNDYWAPIEAKAKICRGGKIVSVSMSNWSVDDQKGITTKQSMEEVTDIRRGLKKRKDQSAWVVDTLGEMRLRRRVHPEYVVVMPYICIESGEEHQEGDKNFGFLRNPMGMGESKELPSSLWVSAQFNSDEYRTAVVRIANGLITS